MGKATRQKERLEIHLDTPMLAWLRIRAKREGRSLGDLIRTAVAEFMERTK